MSKIIIKIDGGARGNPGPAASGVVFKNEEGKIIKEYGKYLGERTNNEAEYEALILALKKAKLLFGKEKVKNNPISIISDSKLLVKQMKGEYKIEKEHLQKLFLEAWNLKIDCGGVDFILVPREENKEPDRVLNEVLDKETSSQKLF